MERHTMLSLENWTWIEPTQTHPWLPAINSISDMSHWVILILDPNNSRAKR